MLAGSRKVNGLGKLSLTRPLGSVFRAAFYLAWLPRWYSATCTGRSQRQPQPGEVEVLAQHIDTAAQALGLVRSDSADPEDVQLGSAAQTLKPCWGRDARCSSIIPTRRLAGRIRWLRHCPAPSPSSPNKTSLRPQRQSRSTTTQPRSLLPHSTTVLAVDTAHSSHSTHRNPTRRPPPPSCTGTLPARPTPWTCPQRARDAH